MGGGIQFNPYAAAQNPANRIPFNDKMCQYHTRLGIFSMNLRPVQLETDLPRIVDLINVFETEPTTPSRTRQWLAQVSPGRSARAMAPINPRGEIAGFSSVIHETWYPEKHFYIWMVVLPDQRGQGIGALMYADAQAYLARQDAAFLQSETRDNDPTSLRFAQQRGFSIRRQRFESTLDLTTFDERPYCDLLPALKANGIRFFTLADCAGDPEARAKLYEVNCITSLETPGTDGTFMSYAEFEQCVYGADWFRADGQWLAAEGDRFVGLSAVKLIPETQGSYNLMTGVVSEYRGRKIAQAVKLCAICYAQENGARTMRTHNNSLNTPMLAINRKLGYRPEPGIYVLHNQLR